MTTFLHYPAGEGPPRLVRDESTEGLREAIADEIQLLMISEETTYLEMADALLAGPLAPLPRLTAAVRAALTLADELGRDAWNVCGTEASRAKADAADRLRSTVTAALAAGGAE